MCALGPAPLGVCVINDGFHVVSCLQLLIHGNAKYIAMFRSTATHNGTKLPIRSSMT